MSRSHVWSELSEKGKRTFSIVASLMMIALCFNVLVGNANATEPSSSLFDPQEGFAPEPIQNTTTDADKANASDSDAIVGPVDYPPLQTDGGVEEFGSPDGLSVSQIDNEPASSYLCRENGELRYWTSYGLYSFNESMPFESSLRSYSGTLLATNASFTIATAGPSLVPFEAKVIVATDDVLAVRYYLTNNTWPTAVAEMLVTYDFTGGKAPKITASVLDIADDVKDWAVVWTLTMDQAAAISMPKDAPPITIQCLADGIGWDELADQINFSLSFDVFSDRLQVDWSDAKVGTPSVVRDIDKDGASIYSMNIEFPVGQRTIDPTFICTTSDTNATEMSCQRKTFWNDGYYWIFYTNAGSIRYACSIDGATWISATVGDGASPATGSGFDVAYRNGRVLLGWVDATSMANAKLGTITGNSITWENKISTGPVAVQPVSVAIGEDNSLWWAYLNKTGSNPTFISVLTRALPNTYFVLSLARAVIFEPGGSNQYWTVLLPFAGGNVALLDTVRHVTGGWNSYIRYQYYYATAGGIWTSATSRSVDMSAGGYPTYKSKLFSGASSSNGSIFIGYKSASSNWIWVMYIFPNGVWGTYPLFDSDTTFAYPEMSVDANGWVHAFFVTQSGSTFTINHYQRPINGPVSQLFVGSGIYAETGNTIKGLTTCLNPIGTSTLLWTEELGTTRTVVFASIPLPFGTPGASADPWSRPGLSPFGTYFASNGVSVAPGSGSLSIVAGQVTIPGRGGVNLDVSLIYQQPKYFSKLDGSAYTGTQCSLAENVGGYWSLNLPYFDDWFTYIYLGNGERYIIQWGNKGNLSEFVNQIGTHFILRDVRQGGNIYYELMMTSGLRYKFAHDTHQLLMISDLTNYNPASSVYSEPYNHLDLAYEPGNGRLLSITDVMGRSITFHYGAFLDRITRPDGKVITIGYTNDGPTSITNENGSITQFDYIQAKGGCIGNITFPTGGKLTFTYVEDTTPTTEFRSWLVSTETVKDPTVQIRKTTFDYKVLNGRITYTKITNSNETNAVQGYTAYVFKSSLGQSISYQLNASNGQMSRICTSYDIYGQPVRFDHYLGDSSLVNYTEYASYDDWGNRIFSQDALGHDSYVSFANTSTQNSFQGGDILKRTTSGLILYDAFDNWNYSYGGWIAEVTSGSVVMDGTTDPPRAPAVKVSRTTSAAGNADVYNTFTTQSGDFYIQLSFRAVTTNRDYILGIGTGGTRIYFMADSGQFKYYDGSNFFNVASCGAGVWYEVGFAAHPSINTYDVYINGILVKSAAPMTGTSGSGINNLRLQAGYSGMSSASLLFDNVRIYKSLSVSITGLGTNYYAELYGSNGTLIGRSMSGSFTLTLTSFSTPSGYFKLWRTGNYTIYTAKMDIFGGDVFGLNLGECRSNVGMNLTGYSLYSDQMIDGDGWPGAPVTIYGSTDATWVSNLVDSVQGSYYHKSAYVPASSPSPSHYHGFLKTSWTGMWIPGYDVLTQYIWLEEGKIPYEIMIQYYFNGVWKRAYWAPTNSDIITVETSLLPSGTAVYQGQVPQTTGRWLQLTIRASDLGINDAGANIKGIVYGLYGGMARWDHDSRSTAGIKIFGLTTGMTVKMKLDNGTVLSGVAATNSATIYDRNVNVFPISAVFSIYDNTGALKYISPKVQEIYNRDFFTYSNSNFYVNSVKMGIHCLPVGTFEYQDYAKTQAQKKESYVKYDVEGNAVETKASTGTSWVYNRLAYDQYKNLLWAIDATGRKTTYEYSSSNGYTYPTAIIEGDRMDTFDFDTSWTYTETPARSWLGGGYSNGRYYSAGSSINLGFDLAPGTNDNGEAKMSKEYQTNGVGEISLRFYLESYSHNSVSGQRMDSGLRMRLYNSAGSNYATYTYWLTCWDEDEIRPAPDATTKVVWCHPQEDTWLNPVLHPSSDFTIDWTTCIKVVFELYTYTFHAQYDTLNLYFDDFTFNDVIQTEFCDSFDADPSWTSYKNIGGSTNWMYAQYSSAISYSSPKSLEFSFINAPGGYDYGTVYMWKEFRSSRVDKISLRMNVDLYYHDMTWTQNTMDSGVRIRLYNSAGSNYATYTYWLACWSGLTDNKTVSDPSTTKCIWGRPTQDTWLNPILYPNNDFSIDWSQCDKVRFEIYSATSFAKNDYFKMYVDDFAFNGFATAKTSFTYDNNNGRILSIKDPSGNSTSYWYDVIGRIKQANNSDSISYCQFLYDDSAANKLTTLDERGNKTIFYFDKIGREKKVERWGLSASAYSTTQYTYNWLDEVASSTDERGHLTLMTYDYLGRPLSIKNPSGSQATNTYDNKANTVTSVDEMGHKVIHAYDYLGRLNSTKECYGSGRYNVTMMTYDAAGHLLTVRDNKTQVTRMSYDRLGRETGITFPDSRTESTGYDESGRVISQTSRNGIVVTSSYDTVGNLIRLVGGGETIKTRYDAESRVISTSNSLGIISYQYNNRDMVSQMRQTINSTSYTFYFRYDATGALISTDYPDGRSLSCIYDAYGRVREMKQGSTRLVNYTYNTDDSVSKKYFCNGNSTVTYNYNNRDWLTSIVAKNGTTSILDLTYTCFNDGNVQSIVDAVGGAGTENYVYDQQERLTQATGYWGTLKYTYDAVGNRLSKTTNTTTKTYTIGSYNQLSGDGDFSYVYDRNGNVIYKNSSASVGYHFYYDAFDHMIRVDKKDTPGGSWYVVAQYFYDANGARAKTKEGGTVIDFIYSGHDPMYQNSSAGNNKFVYVGGCLEVRVFNGVDKYCYVSDGLGSTRLVLKNGNSGGAAVVFKAKTYLPFGTAMGVSGSDKVTYAGEIKDDPAGLFYLFARYYDPETGRFLSLDPLLGSLYGPQTQNRYAYCANNPEIYTDPSGAIIETLFDVGCVAWDIEELWNHPSWENVGYLLLDIGCAAVPFLPAIGGIVRLGKVVEKTVETTKVVEKGLDVVRTAERAEDFSDFFRWMDEGGDFRYIDEADHYSQSQDVFRRGLGEHTGIVNPKGMEAHHIFPRSLGDKFMEKWGIDVWNPRYGSWVEASAHRHFSPGYNVAWKQFLKSPHTIEEVFDKARMLGGDYGFKVLF